MQKWEYLWIRVAPNDRVFSINERSIGEVPLFRQTKGPSIWEVMNELGEQGWEAVGVADSYIIVMKRPS